MVLHTLCSHKQWVSQLSHSGTESVYARRHTRGRECVCFYFYQKQKQQKQKHSWEHLPRKASAHREAISRGDAAPEPEGGTRAPHVASEGPHLEYLSGTLATQSSETNSPMKTGIRSEHVDISLKTVSEWPVCPSQEAGLASSEKCQSHPASCHLTPTSVAVSVGQTPTLSGRPTRSAGGNLKWGRCFGKPSGSFSKIFKLRYPPTQKFNS